MEMFAFGMKMDEQALEPSFSNCGIGNQWIY
jgi:hypothetical protein